VNFLMLLSPGLLRQKMNRLCHLMFLYTTIKVASLFS
jgi:hypothetical protein